MGQDVGAVAEDEGVGAVVAPDREPQRSGERDALPVDAGDSARHREACQRVEGREDRAAVRGVGQALERGIEREDQVAGSVVERPPQHGVDRRHAILVCVSPILADNPLLRATVSNFFFFLSLNGFILLPLYIAALGGTEVEIGAVMGLYNAVGIVCQPLIGPWTDAVGRRPFMLAGVALVIIAALLATAAPSIPLLAVVRVLPGLGFSCCFVSHYSLVMDLVPPARRGWALGIYGVAGLTATALAPLLSEWVIRRLGFRALFAMAAAVATVAGSIVLRLREPGRATPRPLHGFPWERGALRESFRLSMGVTAFFGLGAGTIFVFLPTFAESLGVETLALFYTAYALAAIGVRVLGGRFIDTHGRRAVIVPSMLVQTIATGLLAVMGFLVTRTSQTPVVPVLFLAGLLSGGAHGFLYPGLAALVTDQTPAERRGVLAGIFRSVFLTGQRTGAFAFRYITHGIGYAFMWTLLTSLLFAGFALSLKLDRA